MPNNTKQMKCGGCGCETFTIHQNIKKEGKDSYLSLLTECTDCKSINELSVQFETPSIVIDWGEKATGKLCVFD